MDFHVYGGKYRIPVMTGKSARAFYNLPDDEIDRLRCGTKFTNDGECMDPDGFRGSPFESRFQRFDDQECRERAEFLEQNEASILHLFEDNKVPVKNQNGHGYCWGYGAASAYEANRLVAGSEYVELNPHSVCSEVKRGRDQGGWANEFLRHAQEAGVVPASHWRAHDRNYRAYDTPEVRAERSKYKPDEWVDIPRGDMPALRSLLASNFGCGMGLMWWGHLVAFLAVTWSDKHGWLYLQRNSHGPRFGWNGYCWHSESSARHGGGSTVMTGT